MSDLAKRLQQARRHLVVPMDEEQLGALRNDVLRAHRRAKQRRVVGTGVLAALVVVVLGAIVLRRRATVGEPTQQVDAQVRIAAGGMFEVDGDSSLLRTIARDEQGLRLELLRGTASFSVEPQGGRTVSITAAGVIVEVVGTEFDVALRGSEVDVAVSHGRVKVTCPGVVAADRAKLLGKGERRLCAASAEAPAAALPESSPGPGGSASPSSSPAPTGSPSMPREDSPSDATHAPATSGGGVQRAADRGYSSPAWRTLAERGEFTHAYDAMKRAGSDAVRNSPEDLMQAADVARLSGHPQEALLPLERVLKHHPRDPRAPLAAFTLGRVHLEELGNPRSAAEAFAKARALAPDGPLAQDALAREVEALARVGDSSRAHELALEYVRRYPSGSKLESVKRHGGLQ